MLIYVNLISKSENNQNFEIKSNLKNRKIYYI